MDKKQSIISIKGAACLLSVLVLAALLLTACGEPLETPVGEWSSSDGSKLSITENTFTLTDQHGSIIISDAPYEWKNDCFYITINGESLKVFKVSITNNESMLLTYTQEIKSDMQAENDYKIKFSRIKKSTQIIND